MRDKDLDVVLFRRYRWTDGDSGSYFCGGRNWKMGFMRGTDIIHEVLAEETVIFHVLLTGVWRNANLVARLTSIVTLSEGCSFEYCHSSPTNWGAGT